MNSTGTMWPQREVKDERHTKAILAYQPPSSNQKLTTSDQKISLNHHRDAGKLLEWLGLAELLSQPREERGQIFLNSQLSQQRDFCEEHLFGNLEVTSFTNIGSGFPGKELY